MSYRSRTKRSRVNATGRNIVSERFVQLPHKLLHSSAYRALSPNARSLLVELISIFNGSNNGSIYLSVRDGAARLGVVDTNAASRAFDELQHMGFIALCKEASFHIKAAESSRARTWRLTWLSTPGRAPTNEYREFEPLPKTKERRRMEAGLRAIKSYQRAQTREKFPVRETTTLS